MLKSSSLHSQLGRVPAPRECPPPHPCQSADEHQVCAKHVYRMSFPFAILTTLQMLFLDSPKRSIIPSCQSHFNICFCPGDYKTVSNSCSDKPMKDSHFTLLFSHCYCPRIRALLSRDCTLLEDFNMARLACPCSRTLSASSFACYDLKLHI